MIGLAVFSGVMLSSALMVVRTQNLVHSVLWLAVTLISTAGMFVILGAPFLAGIQLMLYTGGIITLMLFGVMLTGRHNGIEIPNPSEGHVAGAGAAVAFLTPALYAIWSFEEVGPALAPVDAKTLGIAFLGPHLIAFEALSVLLLAAMIGAIVLVRRKDP
jgi:NADH:ubiquinone oxidoreductase subunit 6 (subunit J)